MRSEPCACGGVIHCESPEFVAVAVGIHNTSLSHLIWRSRFSAERPTVVASDDLSRLSDDASASLPRIVH